MVRKHTWRSKFYAKKTRPKTPAPKDGWLLDELVSLSELPITTIRYYIQQRLIRPIERRGTATRYPRRSLLLVLGLTRLKSEGKTTLAEKKRKLDTMGDLELKAWLRTGYVPKSAAAALGIEAEPARAFNTSHATAPVIDAAGAVVEQWQRVELLPGLELMIRADVKEPVRLAAQRICETYAVR